MNRDLHYRPRLSCQGLIITLLLVSTTGHVDLSERTKSETMKALRL